MSRVKDILVKVIPAKIANDFVKKHHYSGKVVQNSCLHFGAFLDGVLHGVLSFGSSLDKSKTIGLVENTSWNGYLELNRMAFDDYLPKYSESRVISVCLKLIKKQAPQIKWILSYSDGCDCGDGTIYRASGFFLTLIKPNSDLFLLPNGKKIHSMTIKSNKKIIQKYGSYKKYLDQEHWGWKKINGFQLRYIYLIDKSCKITVPIIPFSKIDEIGAGMYRGKKITIKERKSGVDGVCSNTPSFQDGEDVQVDLNAPSDEEYYV